MKEKALLRMIEILASIIVLTTSILTLTMDMNFKGIPALSLGILMGMFSYEEWIKEKKNMPTFFLLFIACILNCFVGIMLFF